MTQLVRMYVPYTQVEMFLFLSTLMTITSNVQMLQDLEDQAGIDLDAIIHKATQEHAEFIEAMLYGSSDDLQDEIGDVLANVLSATQRVGIDLNHITRDKAPKELITSSILAGRRNEQLQTLRGIYSRTTKSATQESVLQATSAYLNHVLARLPNETSIEQLLLHNSQKREGRLDCYTRHVDLTQYITDVPDFPKSGILFKDITPLLASPEAMGYAIDQLAILTRNADVIMGLDARGFIFGSAIAKKLHKPFVLGRKPGKLPREHYTYAYDLEYGKNDLSMHTDSIQPGQRVAIIDDLLATGGTAFAATQLVEQAGGIVDGCYFVIGLDDLPGKERLKDYKTKTLVTYS